MLAMHILHSTPHRLLMDPRRLTRRNALQGLGLVAIAGGLGSLGLWLACHRRPPTRPKKPPRPVPQPLAGWMDRTAELHARIAANDFWGAAESASYLTDEAFTRADRVVQAWLALRGEYRGLIPRRLDHKDGLIWNYKDCAADIYCHLVIEASLIAPSHLTALREMLATERAIATGLPASIRLDSGELLGETVDQRIFGAVEYAKDGLVPVLERVGPTEWLDRLHEVVNAIIAASPVETPYGRLPCDGSEKNGEFLQVLARLYRRERRPEHLAAARAIADAYVQEVLPNNNYLPPLMWNFATHAPRDSAVYLRDHGNEIVAGLAEWVMAEADAPESRASDYAPALERMMDVLLDCGRDAAGLWTEIIAKEGEDPPPAPAQPANDNWGNLTAAYVGYAMSLPKGSPRRQRYLAESARALDAAIQYHHAAWQNGSMDGHADSIEGALYLQPFLTVDGAARWIDEEAGVLLAYQKANGFVGGSYLDGNFVRTVLLYALFRTQGARLDPWEPGLRLGAVASPDCLNVVIGSKTTWNGRLIFDRARHRDYLILPYEYPRLNGWPEWFVVDPASSYAITQRFGEDKRVEIVRGDELLKGVKVELPSEGLRLEIRLATP